MKTEQLGVVTSIQNLMGAVASKGYCINANGVTFNSTEESNTFLGISLADTNDLEMIPVAVTGIALAKTAGAITKGESVYCDGRISQMVFTDPKTANEVQSVIGIALDSATGADEYIRVRIK
jgi:Uncharacterized conserved protein (DUF2190)